MLSVNRAFVPPKRGGFDENGENDGICLTNETRALLFKPRETENDENGGCPAGKGMVYQKHRFLDPDSRRYL